VVNAMEVFDSLDDRTDLPLDTVEFLLSAFVVALAHSIQPGSISSRSMSLRISKR
jgi:hypothetical protein